jgi:hypothetical protein
MQVRAGGDLGAAYHDRVAFQSSLAARATAVALDRAAAIADRPGFDVGPFSGDAARTPTGTEQEDTITLHQYANRLLDGVAFARQLGAAVIVVTQPYISDAREVAARALASARALAFPTDPAVQYVNLGTTVDLRDRAIAYDGLHLVAAGHEAIARHLVEPVLNATAATRCGVVLRCPGPAAVGARGTGIPHRGHWHSRLDADQVASPIASTSPDLSRPRAGPQMARSLSSRHPARVR